ncbi:MAG: hypothetical protein R2710_16185 [Acidimicrobiales bacterium]
MTAAPEGTAEMTTTVDDSSSWSRVRRLGIGAVWTPATLGRLDAGVVRHRSTIGRAPRLASRRRRAMTSPVAAARTVAR